MTGKTHLAFGIGIATIGSIYYISNYSDISASGLLFLGCTIGSIFPDIDTPKSMIGKYLLFIPKIVNKMFGHRNFIHSPAFLILLSLGCLYFFPELKFLIYGFVVGFLSHLLLDMCNKAGIPLLYPFSRKRFHIMSTKSGAKYECLTAFLLYLVFFGIFIYKMMYLFVIS